VEIKVEAVSSSIESEEDPDPGGYRSEFARREKARRLWRCYLLILAAARRSFCEVSSEGSGNTP